MAQPVAASPQAALGQIRERTGKEHVRGGRLSDVPCGWEETRPNPECLGLGPMSGGPTTRNFQQAAEGTDPTETSNRVALP